MATNHIHKDCCCGLAPWVDLTGRPDGSWLMDVDIHSLALFMFIFLFYFFFKNHTVVVLFTPTWVRPKALG